MLKAFKTEIKPTVSQSAKIRQSIGVCRWLYKMYKRGFIEVLKREQRRLSRKHEEKKKRGEKAAAYFANIEKTKQKVQKLHQKIANKRTDYINKTVVEIIKQKPRFISLEDLNIRGMMKNRHLSKAIGKQKFYEFKTKLEMKARLSGIEIGIANRYYPSSKKCSQCGEIKADLKLKDRIYHCEHCGLKIDRDINAAINLKNAEEYKIA